MTKEYLVCLLFRFQGECTLINVAAQKKGDVYHVGCEYASTADVCVFPSMLDVQLRLTLATPWTLACQATLYMGCCRQDN